MKLWVFENWVGGQKVENVGCVARTMNEAVSKLSELYKGVFLFKYANL